MDNKDLLKELESLKKRVSELESLKKGNLSMFGRSYSLAGNSDSDFLIKTKGLVKILWGNKFIDLIKDGKINVDALFIYKEDSVGSKDGIYIVGDGDKSEIWLVSGDLSINLMGEIGNTYVSFLGPQLATPDLKYLAMSNIGFLYKDMDAVDASSIKSGIIYIESEKKLYLVEEGIISEFTVSFPNPFTDQFVIAKLSNSIGSLLILGYGISNSVAFTDLFIYLDETDIYFDSNNTVNFRIEEDNILIMTLAASTFFNTVISQRFESRGAGPNNGFRLYVADGMSTLEIDRIVVRQGESGLIVLYPQYWLGDNGIIKSFKAKEDVLTREGESEESKDIEVSQFLIILNQDVDVNVGDVFILYLQEDKLEEVPDPDGGTYTKESIQLTPLKLTVQEILQDGSITVSSSQGILFLLMLSIIGKFIFKISSASHTFNPIRLRKNSIDIVHYDDGSETIITRIGSLDDIIEKDDYTTIGEGIYSKKAYFLEVLYTKNYQLLDSDDSTKLASTEWVLRKLKDVGAIKFDLAINTPNPDIPAYFLQSGLFDLYTNQKEPIQLYLGLNGIITIDKSSTPALFSAIVKAKTENETWSYRSVYCTYDLSTNTWDNVFTYIIQDYFNPGYYYSSEMKQDKPVSPVYIGTSIFDFLVDEDKLYLLYSNDGKVWNIINKYIPPDTDRIYIRSTLRSTVTYSSTGLVKYAPSGFICYSNLGQTVITNFGKSNYIPNIISIDTFDPEYLSKLPNIISDADPGLVPYYDGYKYLFSIQKNADKTNIDSWKYEINTGSTDSLLNSPTEVLDWGNSTSPPGFLVFEVDQDSKIIGLPNLDVFINGKGTKSNWNNPIWRNSFLMSLITTILKFNKDKYNELLGWSFLYASPAFIKGYSGYASCRAGNIEPPTSDDPTNIGYINTLAISLVSGLVIGSGIVINFLFNNVRVGKQLPYVVALESYTPGFQLSPLTLRLYNVAYETCLVNIQELA